MKFNLYGFVIVYTHATKAPCISDVSAGRRWWFMKKASINILKMRKDAETFLKSRVPLLPSLYCPWNDSMNMCRAYHLQNLQHETHFLNSLVGYKMRRIVGQMMNISNTQEPRTENMIYSCVSHSTVESKYNIII